MIDFPENYTKYLPKYVEDVFKKMFSISLELLFNCFEDFQIFFQFFSKCYPGFSNFYISLEFLPSFFKIIAKSFRILKFHQKHGSTNFCTAMFLHIFFKISSQLIIIWSYTITSAKPLQENWKFSQNFIKIFQCSYQPILKEVYTSDQVASKMLVWIVKSQSRSSCCDESLVVC